MPQRINIALMGFLAIVVAYTMRTCLSVAIIEMVVPVNQTGSNDSFVCPMIDDGVLQDNNATDNVYK